MTKRFSILALVAFATPWAGADVVLQPSQLDLFDLDHGRNYAWGFDLTGKIPAGSEITEVTLSIDNIEDWIHPEVDVLYLHLLDDEDAPIGITQATDYSNLSDAFAGKGVLIGTYTDLGPGTEDLNYAFSSISNGDGKTALDYFLQYYSDDKRLGLGFDPDCHYWNDGITLTIQTAPAVPEAGSLFLLGSCFLAALKLRKKKKD